MAVPDIAAMSCAAWFHPVCVYVCWCSVSLGHNMKDGASVLFEGVYDTWLLSCWLMLMLLLVVQSFASEQCPEGFVAVKGNTLRILSVDNIGETFNQSISRLRYTPRRLLIHPDYKTLIVAESDYQAVPLADNPELQKRLVVSADRGPCVHHMHPTRFWLFSLHLALVSGCPAP